MKVACLAACVVPLCAAAGCGSATSRSTAGDGSAPTTSAESPKGPLLHLDTDNDKGASEVVLLAEQGTKTAAPRDLYAVFARKQSDEEAQIAPTLLDDYPCARAGSENIAEQARILLHGVGGGQNTLVAVPTADGSVSVAVFPKGGATCALPIEDGLILAADEQGGSATVYGMVDDGVRSVDVIVDSQAHRAKLSQNGFAVALHGSNGMDVDKLVLRHSDGSISEFPPG
jgi:hypothetical protein